TPTPSQASGSTCKLHPLQVRLVDLPADFQENKEALFIHVKMMAGLYLPNDILAPPNKNLLKEFYSRFSRVAEVNQVVNDPLACDLVAQEEILVLRLNHSGGRTKIAKGLANLDKTYILYVHGLLAKVGLRIWAPDLNAVPDTLYNSACRIVALKSFRELLASGAYNYMNINLKHTDSMSLNIAAYNHYVHFHLAKKFKSEAKSPGQTQEMNARRNNQKKSQIEFLLAHRAKYPPHYRKALEDILAHSDDECMADSGIYVIKTLEYQSKNVNKFMHQLDSAMLKDAKMNGTLSQQCVCKLPKIPQPSLLVKPPKWLPIDFYDLVWYKGLGDGLKSRIADTSEVAFLPDALQSFSNHPDKKLSDKAFIAKYYDILTQPYNLLAEVDVDEDEDDANDDSEDIMEDEDDALEKIESEELEFYSEGEFGALYD
ncbi:hypothetical protein CROQUDRAFT_49646, partial [Cronartium quercuum f. sp. fusiforme G11]